MSDDDDLVLSRVDPRRDGITLRRIKDLLTAEDLGYDDDIEQFVVARQGLEVVACLGLAGRVLKCAAVRRDMQGHDLARRLMEEMNYLALEAGRSHLFLFTKPQYRETFTACGFHALAEVPGKAVLMENTPHGITRYVERLAQERRPGSRIGGIVVNANPFTFGHAHLVRTAARDCDVVHVFVVREDASQFSYADRLALVRAGVAAMDISDRVVVHEGSEYIVSRATFPSYFLKDAADLATAATGLDLQLFRRWIAPALGIRHRYVGTEPFSQITRLYNDEMAYWLTRAPSPAPAIDVHVVERLTEDDRVVSATRVRKLIADGNLAEIERLVPPTTFDLIRTKFAPAGAHQ